MLRRPIGFNQILTFDHFIEDPEKTLAGEITTGHRLFALQVDSNKLPTLYPGMEVDIAAPFSGGGLAPQVLLVLEKITIVNVGNLTIVEDDDGGRRARARGNFKKIDIQVPVEQALQLSRIQKIITGPFELYIRPANEEKASSWPGGGINPAVLEKIGVRLGGFQ